MGHTLTLILLILLKLKIIWLFLAFILLRSLGLLGGKKNKKRVPQAGSGTGPGQTVSGNGKLDHNLVTSAFVLRKHDVTKNIGIVRGITVRSRGALGNMAAGFQRFFGGNITIYTELCEQARQEAFDLMCERAAEIGANAVVGMRYDATEISASVTEVLAYGTAVTVKEKRSSDTLPDNGWDGLLAEKQGQRTSVKVRLSPQGLRITAESWTERVWPYSEIKRVRHGLPGNPVRLERAGVDLVVFDARFLRHLNESRPKKARHLFRSTASAYRRDLLGPGTIGRRSSASWSGACPTWLLCSPRMFLFLLKEAWERRHSTEPFRPANAAMMPRPSRLSRVLSRGWSLQVKDCPYQFKVMVVKNKEINAFAFPGGTIVVYTGLLARTHSPEEMAGVLAHEMQHVLNRHATRRMISQSSTLILFSILAGREAGSLGWGGVRALSLLKFSRDDEAEADRKGLGMLLAAKVDPVGMVRFFSVLEEQSDTPALLTYFSTHPRTEDRISELKHWPARVKDPIYPCFPALPGKRSVKTAGIE